MKVNVAGAGAGKTTKMADIITEYIIPDGKIIFCIAFTNAAVDHIKVKVTEKLGNIPNNIKIGTIHSFLYKELIVPYYYFLYGKHYERLSVIDLPLEERAKAFRLSELEKANVLHVTAIPQRAKWVACKKSGDVKAIKELRKRILSHFSSYCAAIFVDEAQDINKEISQILASLDSVGIEVVLYGDPKQDVKGFGLFRAMIDNAENVTYISECHRCPQKHLNLSNLLAPELEKQEADKANAIGSITIAFESEIENIQEYIDAENYGLRYISMKRDIYCTHDKKEHDQRFETLFYMVYRAMDDKWHGQKNDIAVRRSAYYVTERMLKEFDLSGKAEPIISNWVKNGVFDRLSKKDYRQMISVFTPKEINLSYAVVLSSIEIIKGLEAEKCLFVLTTDLAPYLFQEKNEDNKMSHLLYVALTRSLDNLTILITKKVEDQYTKEFILHYFATNILQSNNC